MFDFNPWGEEFLIPLLSSQLKDQNWTTFQKIFLMTYAPPVSALREVVRTVVIAYIFASLTS